MKEKVIEFLRSKDYKFIRNIGQGGTGKTILIEDETINEKFVCKKYSPYYEVHADSYYGNFVDEIKLLHLLYHRNVVRVFNYYLYPEKITGYILMEFINGECISDYIRKNPDRLNDVFIQTISGFRHLEENGILHRDIRPENIMVSREDVVKIIDLGFGKKIEFNNNFENSISINWRYSIPNDFKSKTYDFTTEVYFVGKLFDEIIQENNLQNFSYSSVLLNMIHINQDSRIPSFFEVDRKIISDDSVGIEFTYDEKEIYKKFADEISSLYSKIETGAEYLKDIDTISASLDDCYRNSLLEDYVQNPASIARSFVRGNYYYQTNARIYVQNLKNFLQLFKSVSSDKKRTILNNLWQRLDCIKRYNRPIEDDLPF